MHHRRLRPEELAELETDFIRFLSSQGIDGSTWTTMKTEQPERAEEVLDEFSRFVYESTLDQIEYLEYKSQNDIKCFHCREEGMVLLGVFVEGNAEVNFREDFDLEAARQKIVAAGARLKMYQSRKSYHPDRRSELFKMLENGCRISRDGLIFKTLDGLVKAREN